MTIDFRNLPDSICTVFGPTIELPEKIDVAAARLLSEKAGMAIAFDRNRPTIGFIRPVFMRDFVSYTPKFFEVLQTGQTQSSFEPCSFAPILDEKEPKVITANFAAAIDDFLKRADTLVPLTKGDVRVDAGCVLWIPYYRSNIYVDVHGTVTSALHKYAARRAACSTGVAPPPRFAKINPDRSKGGGRLRAMSAAGWEMLLKAKVIEPYETDELGPYIETRSGRIIHPRAATRVPA